MCLCVSVSVSVCARSQHTPRNTLCPSALVSPSIRFLPAAAAYCPLPAVRCPRQFHAIPPYNETVIHTMLAPIPLVRLEPEQAAGCQPPATPEDVDDGSST